MFASCPDCQCSLIPTTFSKKAAGGAAENRRPHVEYVELCRPQAFPVAMLIKQTLEKNGVETLIQGGHSLSLFPQLAFGGELRIFVDKSHLEYARELYHAFFESDGETDYVFDDSYE